MAGRGKQTAVPRGHLDVSFEARQRAKTFGPNNGYRPHGGYRGTQKHPLSRHSFQKEEESSTLHVTNDSDTETDLTSSVPKWAYHILQLPSHSGESHLHRQNLLKTTPKAISERSASLQSARSVTSGQSYHSIRSHQYLSETELWDASDANVNLRLGRPTRTSLLRARQRCNSAPVNAYENRRELQKKLHHSSDFQKSLMGSISNSLRSLMNSPVPEGESAHGYFTGARYNRANCLDAKSLCEFGVYMPRSNPENLFVVKGYRDLKDSNITHTPPVSPVEMSLAESSRKDETRTVPQSPISQQEVRDSLTSSPVPSQAVINLNDVLNIKGCGYVGGAAADPTEGFHHRSPRGPRLSAHHKDHPSKPSPLGCVFIKGKSLGLGGQPVKKTVAPNNPPSPRQPALTVKDIRAKLILENLKVKSSKPELAADRINKVMVDASVCTTAKTNSLEANEAIFDSGDDRDEMPSINNRDKAFQDDIFDNHESKTEDISYGSLGKTSDTESGNQETVEYYDKDLIFMTEQDSPIVSENHRTSAVAEQNTVSDDNDTDPELDLDEENTLNISTDMYANQRRPPRPKTAYFRRGRSQHAFNFQSEDAKNTIYPTSADVGDNQVLHTADSLRENKDKEDPQVPHVTNDHVTGEAQTAQWHSNHQGDLYSNAIEDTASCIINVQIRSSSNTDES